MTANLHHGLSYVYQCQKTKTITHNNHRKKYNDTREHASISMLSCFQDDVSRQRGSRFKMAAAMCFTTSSACARAATAHTSTAQPICLRHRIVQVVPDYLEPRSAAIFQEAISVKCTKTGHLKSFGTYFAINSHKKGLESDYTRSGKNKREPSQNSQVLHLPSAPFVPPISLVLRQTLSALWQSARLLTEADPTSVKGHVAPTEV